MSKYVYSFGGGKADGDGTMKDKLGGKGSGLAEMSRAGLPVPPGFTIATDVCNIYFKNGNQVPEEIRAQVVLGGARSGLETVGAVSSPAAGSSHGRTGGFPIPGRDRAAHLGAPLPHSHLPV